MGGGGFSIVIRAQGFELDAPAAAEADNVNGEKHLLCLYCITLMCRGTMSRHWWQCSNLQHTHTHVQTQWTKLRNIMLRAREYWGKSQTSRKALTGWDNVRARRADLARISRTKYRRDGRWAKKKREKRVDSCWRFAMLVERDAAL